MSAMQSNSAFNELAEVVPPDLAHVFAEKYRGLKPITPKLLPLRSVTLEKLERMQHEIEEAMKSRKNADPRTW